MPTLDVAINALRAQLGARQFDAAVKRVQVSAAKATASVVTMDKASTSLGTTMSRMGKYAVGAMAAYGAFKFVKGAVKEFAAFEKQLAEVSTMLDDQTMHYLPQYKQQISDLSVAYGESTQALSKGLYDILSASVDASQAMDVLEASTVAAKAGLSDTGIAADAITTILNSYQMGADQAGRVSDVLFATIKRGKTTFNELAPSIGKVTSLAAAAGLSLEEVSASLSTMTRAGVQTDIAITALKAILTTFLSPQENAVAVAKEWGLELNTNTLRTQGLVGVMQQLTRMSQENVSAIFGNVRALTGLSAMLQQVEGYQTDLQMVTDNTGQSQEALAKVTQTLDQRFKELTETWNRFKRETGEGWGETIDDIIWLLKGTTEYSRKIGHGFDVAGRKAASLYLKARGWNDRIAEGGQDVLSYLTMMDIDLGLNSKRWFELADSLDNYQKENQRVTASQEEFVKGLKEQDEALRDAALGVAGWRNAVEGGKDATSNFIQPSKELTDALQLIENQMRVVNGEIEDFGKSDFDKKLKEIEAQGKKLGGKEWEQYWQALDDLKKKQQELDALGRKEEEATARAKEYNDQLQIVEALKEKVQQLKFEKGLIGKTSVEVAKLTAEEESRKELAEVTDEILRKSGKQAAEAYIAEAEAVAKANDAHQEHLRQLAEEKRLIEEKKQAEERVQDYFRELELERELLGLTNDERKRAIRLQKLEQDAKVLGSERSRELVEQYKEELKALRDAEEVAEIRESIREGVQNIARAPLESILSETKTLGELVENEMRNIAENILRTWWEQNITQAITNSVMPFLSGGISSIFGGGGAKAAAGAAAATGPHVAAKGSVFSRNRVYPLKDGGVLDRPVMFPLASGAAIAGEAGPEAVMPLTRTANGKLGVEATGGGTVENKIFNIIDPKVTGAYLDTGEGERKVLNIIRRNRQAIEVS